MATNEEDLFAPEYRPAPDPFGWANQPSAQTPNPNPPEPPPGPSEPAAESPPTEYEINGQRISAERLNQLLEVDRYIQTGGAPVFQQIADVVTGRARVSYEPDAGPSPYTQMLGGRPAQQPPLPPAQGFIPGAPAPGQIPAPAQPQGQGAREQGVEGGAGPLVEMLANEVLAIRAAQAEEAADEARRDLATRYGLTDEQAADVQRYAVDERIIENRARARGRMVGDRLVVPSPRTAITEALEMAARLKGYAPTTAAPTRQQVRAANRQLVGSSGAAASRQPKAPQTREEHDQAMTEELYRHFGMPMPGPETGG